MGVAALKEALPVLRQGPPAEPRLHHCGVDSARAAPLGHGARHGDRFRGASTLWSSLPRRPRAPSLAEAFEAAKAAAAVMAMNNIYYRGKHLLADEGAKDYEDIPARLRMQVIATRGGVEAEDFEFWCLAVSAVNGCGGCLAAHERKLRELGLGRDQIHEALRIASVVHAVAVTLEAEDATAGVTV